MHIRDLAVLATLQARMPEVNEFEIRMWHHTQWSETMWRELLVCLLLATVEIPIGAVESPSGSILLPIEVLGADGTTASRTVALEVAQSESVRCIWLQVHGLRYSEQASVQVNSSPWTPLTNNTVVVAAPGRTYGGIGGGFATLVLTLPLPSGTVVAGDNTVRFRFNQTDGLASGYRVLAWNFLTAEGSKVISPANFVEEVPETWTPPKPDTASIHAGQELWRTASLVASGLSNSPRIQAHCSDCHAHDGRDLKYFNFSNASIVARSRFHGLTTLQGEQIASFIRSLQLPSPGRPWNPPYQPGLGLDEQPISNWAAGAGLSWVLDEDANGLKYLLVPPGKHFDATSYAPADASDLHQMVAQITPMIFRPDSNLNVREIPIAMQLPDWSQWLPRIHPKDAWGADFADSNFATMYDGGASSRESRLRPKTSLRALLTAAQTSDSDLRFVAPAFARWSRARRAFLGRFVKKRTVWSTELTNKVYSTQLWQLMKTWEMTQEFGLEGKGRNFFGEAAEQRTWCNTVPADTAPVATHIPDGPTGVGGNALANEYLSAAWYELQILVNSGNHQHHGRSPVDWVYLIRQFHELYLQSHNPEPVRLLVAVTKALQSTDARLGPDNYSEGWRPEQNIDPRIMINPYWAPFFKPFPFEIRRAIAESVLEAWMEKTLSYPLAKYLPLPVLQRDYTPRLYSDISGGRVWEAAGQFRAAGVSDHLVERLVNWGIAYNDRAAALQYQ